MAQGSQELLINAAAIWSYVLALRLRPEGQNESGQILPNNPNSNNTYPFFVRVLKAMESNGKQRKDMIAHANRGQMEAIGEVALNLLKGNIIVLSSSFKLLKPHRSKLLYLTRKKPSLKQKKEVINQKGGFLSALAALVAPLAVDLLGKVFK